MTDLDIGRRIASARALYADPPKVAVTVYFIRADCPVGYIKIGIANNPKGRLAGMQVHCPYLLRLLATSTGGRKVEKELHRRFHDAHVRGEWFRPTPELLAFIEALPKPLMTDDATVELVARRMQESKAWPAVFRAGTAQELARAALVALTEGGKWIAPRELTDEDADYALSATASHLDIQGSQLTVNREKMKRRWNHLRNKLAEPPMMTVTTIAASTNSIETLKTP